MAARYMLPLSVSLVTVKLENGSHEGTWFLDSTSQVATNSAITADGPPIPQIRDARRLRRNGSAVSGCATASDGSIELAGLRAPSCTVTHLIPVRGLTH